MTALRRFETSLKRLKCANSGHSPRAGRTGQIDPRRAETTLVASSTQYRAIESQNGLIERYAGLSRARRIEFRVGIHLGNVVEEVDGDVVSINVG
jgi:class 3 adenylate cyclase